MNEKFSWLFGIKIDGFQTLSISKFYQFVLCRTPELKTLLYKTYDLTCYANSVCKIITVVYRRVEI